MAYIVDKMDARDLPAVGRSLNHLRRELEKLGNKVHAGMGTGQSQPASAIQQVNAPRGSVQNAIGQAAQPQIAQVAYETALPATGDSLSQTDTYVSFYDTPYRWDDASTSWKNQGPAKVVSVTPVTFSANSTADQNLGTCAWAAGEMNVVGKVYRVSAAGVYTTQAGQTPTLRFRLLIGATVLIEWLPITASASATNMPWMVEGVIGTLAVGAAGNFIVTGWAGAVDGTAPGGVTKVVYGQNTGASASFDLTSALTVQLVARFSTNAVGANTCTQLTITGERLN